MIWRCRGRRRRRRAARRTAPFIATARSSGRPITALPRRRAGRRAHVRRRPQSGRDAAHPRRARGARRASATFFILGRHAERWPELVRARGRRRARDRQPRLLSSQAALQVAGYVRDDLDARHASDRARVRACARRLFRAPHGFRSPWVTPIARSLGQRTVGWSLGVWDSDRPGVERHRRSHGGRRASGLHPAPCTTATATILDGDRMQTARAVPVIVDRLLAQDFRFDLFDAA